MRRRFTKLLVQGSLLVCMIFPALQTYQATANDKPKVLTSFTLLADLTKAIAGNDVDVVSITKPGADIHTYQVTPKDLQRADGAKLILWNGLNLELWFEKFAAAYKDVPSVVLSDGVEPISITSGSYEGAPNPHAWLSRDALTIYLDNIRAALSQILPENSSTFAQNQDEYLKTLDERLDPLIEHLSALPEDRKWLVTSEGAISYLARALGFKELWIWPTNADAIGTPQQTRAVIDAVRENSIEVIFSESTVSPKPAIAIASETNIRYGGVLYVDSLSEPDGPVPTFLDLLVHNLTLIANELEP